LWRGVWGGSDDRECPMRCEMMVEKWPMSLMGATATGGCATVATRDAWSATLRLTGSKASVCGGSFRVASPSYYLDMSAVHECGKRMPRTQARDHSFIMSGVSGNVVPSLLTNE
jgi:hypothetical protein